MRWSAPAPSSADEVGFRDSRLTTSIVVGGLFPFLCDAPMANLIALPIITTFHGDATQSHRLLATQGLVGHWRFLIVFRFQPVQQDDRSHFWGLLYIKKYH
jgi:hypothetical protein